MVAPHRPLLLQNRHGNRECVDRCLLPCRDIAGAWAGDDDEHAVPHRRARRMQEDSGTERVDRRDAAVTASLVGAVVVLVGYAAGAGIRLPVVAVDRPERARPPVAAPSPPASEPVVGGPPMYHPLPATHPGHTAPTHEGHAPAPSPPPTSPNDPAPEPVHPPTDPPQESCQPLTSRLTLVEPVIEPVTSLLGVALTSLPVLNQLAAPPSPDRERRGPATCLVGSLVGPSCCSPSTAARTGVVP